MVRGVIPGDESDTPPWPRSEYRRGHYHNACSAAPYQMMDTIGRSQYWKETGIPERMIPQVRSNGSSTATARGTTKLDTRADYLVVCESQWSHDLRVKSDPGKIPAETTTRTAKQDTKSTYQAKYPRSIPRNTTTMGIIRYRKTKYHSLGYWGK